MLPTQVAVWILAAVTFMCSRTALAQFGKASSPPKAPAVVTDIPLIKCGTCQAYVKQAMIAVKDLRSKEAPGKKVTEADIIETLEKMCNPDIEAGEWIAKIDLKEDKDELKLVDMGAVSECKSECRTIARACEKVSEDMDLSDLSEMLFKGAKRSALEQMACRDQTGVCNKKPPPMPKDRVPGPAFVPLPADKVERDRLMRQMQSAGLKGQMFDRDSLGSMSEDLMSEMKGDEDDDEDLEAAAKAKLPNMVLPPDLTEDMLPHVPKTEL